ncbi:MAG TPA: DUF892 family protein [Candidatus Paceibacterota bacterium]|nr:DUF892 family protein [Candidatus Paceibacterota bacterium]
MPKQAVKKKAAEMTLRDLLEVKLMVLYDAEQQLAKALPKIAKKAADADLKRSFERREKQAEGRVGRLERAFDALGVRSQRSAGEAVKGLIADTEQVLKDVNGAAALDAALVAAVQGAGHWEMAGYQSAIGWAKALDENEIAELLQETFDEEQEAGDELAELAGSKIDEAAMGAAGAADEEEDEDEDEEL